MKLEHFLFTFYMNCNAKRSLANIFPRAAHYMSKSRGLATPGLAHRLVTTPTTLSRLPFPIWFDVYQPLRIKTYRANRLIICRKRLEILMSPSTRVEQMIGKCRHCLTSSPQRRDDKTCIILIDVRLLLAVEPSCSSVMGGGVKCSGTK
jgi:hypothetical protein